MPCKHSLQLDLTSYAGIAGEALGRDDSRENVRERYAGVQLLPRSSTSSGIALEAGTPGKRWPP